MNRQEQDMKIRKSNENELTKNIKWSLFKELMTVFQLLHWNGTLKAFRERRCSRQVRTTLHLSEKLHLSFFCTLIDNFLLQ